MELKSLEDHKSPALSLGPLVEAAERVTRTPLAPAATPSADSCETPAEGSKFVSLMKLAEVVQKLSTDSEPCALVAIP